VVGFVTAKTHLKQKVPPWYAVLREAWRIQVLQSYDLNSNSPNIFQEICPIPLTNNLLNEKRGLHPCNPRLTLVKDD